MHILHILPSAASGGAPYILANYISESVHTNFVIVPNDHEENVAFLKRHAEVFHVNIRTLSIFSLIQILRIASNCRANIIHSHGKAAGIYGRISAIISGRIAVHTFHGWVSQPGFTATVYKFAEYILAKLTRLLIAVSETEKLSIVADCISKEQNVCVQYNPIKLPKTSSTYKLSKNACTTKIVSLSRLSPQKDIEALVKVAWLLGEGYEIHIIGGTIEQDIAYADRLKSLARSASFNNVIFHDDVPQAASLLAEFDVYLSTARWEGLPTAIIEAFLSRLPVVATRCPGNLDVVRHNDTGILCDVGDITALAKAIKSLNDSKMNVLEMTEHAFEFATAYFAPSVIAKSLDDHYERISCGRNSTMAGS
jgi:glycosyltransferase involved in cell wall biosynthesis